MRVAFTLAADLALAGCADDTVNSEIRAKFQSEMEEGSLFGTRVARSKCEIAVNHEFLTGSQANMDLLELEDANRIDLASKVDARQMTESEANLRFLQIRAQLISEAKRRNNEADIAAASVMPLQTTCHSYDNGVGLTTTCY
jgi:hypothetical protein